MSVKMHIVLEGLPERVLATADTLDQAFPGLVTWGCFAKLVQDHAVRLEGEATKQSAKSARPSHLISQTLVSGKTWKLSPVGRVSPQHGAFCASLSKSLLYERAIDGNAELLWIDEVHQSR